MISLKFAVTVFLYTFYTLASVGCGGQPVVPQTLGDIDLPTSPPKLEQHTQPKRSSEDIKKAYHDYLATAEEDDQFKLLAVTRLAEIELTHGGDHNLEGEPTEQPGEASLEHTVALLTQALQDFPTAEANHHSLYQLAKAYDQLGDVAKADRALKTLVNQYPDSRYYLDAKFRIAEAAFISSDYRVAEASYTDVLQANNNLSLKEKALFKRGWSRFKQQRYSAAINDYYLAIESHNFSDAHSLSPSEKELSDEYDRAIGLAFLYLGGAPEIDNYFAGNRSNSTVYRAYNTLSGLQLKQERYSDAIATLEAYILRDPNAKRVATARLDILKIWQGAGFFDRSISAFERLYSRYHAGAPIWQTNHRVSAKETLALKQTIRENTLNLAKHYHNRYNKNSTQSHWQQADLWYQRYLASYQAYARQDKVYPLYAQLLTKAEQYQKALQYYELAAFDGGIVLDKESAYAAIYLSDLIYQSASAQNAKQPQWLDKHLSYAYLYGQLYPSDNNTAKVVEHAAALAFKNGDYEGTIELANILPDSAATEIRLNLDLLKAESYFKQKLYADAEVMFQNLLVAGKAYKKPDKTVLDKLALSVYRQAEQIQTQGQLAAAAEQFLRVYQVSPESELAATAVYDASALFIQQEMWGKAIASLKFFKQTFPHHRYQANVGKKLSSAYLKTDQNLDAAREFESLSGLVINKDEKMAALWQAGELYQNKNDLNSALRAFKDYANRYSRPFDTNMEAMSRIVEMYHALGQRGQRINWLHRIEQTDNKEPKANKSPRTQYISASASFALASMAYDQFVSIALVHPLATSLKQKKSAMQRAVTHYGKASVYNHADFLTQSTFKMGNIYKSFASALLKSERPGNLNQEELEQYNILLEDQAFPFEDKAIEFYEVNVSRIASGTFDTWVSQSLGQLAAMFPARYDREPKLEPYIGELQ